MTEPSASEDVSPSAAPTEAVRWGVAAPVTGPLRWFDRVGLAFVPETPGAPRFEVPEVLEAAPFESEIALQSFLLVEAWWRGTLESDRVVQLLGEEPEGTLDVALTDSELVERAWVGLRPGELDAVARWGAEVLRGRGADAVVCRDPEVLVLLSSTSGVRLLSRPPVEDDDAPQPTMLSETEPPRPPEEPGPPRPAKKRRPPGPPAAIGDLVGPQGPLLDALGLRVASAELRHPVVLDSVLELRRQLLLDGLDAGVLGYDNLLLRFRGLGVDLDPDEVREQLVDLADRLDVHPELALRVTRPRRESLRAAGHDGVVFREGTRDVLVLPHYYLRALRPPGSLWRRVCTGE